MSFRLADLKRSVRKGKEGYQVTPSRLEGRRDAFRIEFLLQQFEGHRGRPRRELEPETLLDFVGDARLGRALLATLAQWYRFRPRRLDEVLADGGAGLRAVGIADPVALRACLYEAVNRLRFGFLEPEGAGAFWQRQAGALGLPTDKDPAALLTKLMRLDRAEEAVLVRTGPAPRAADVMAAYNARAHATLLRGSVEVAIRCVAPAERLRRAVQGWPAALAVETRLDRDTLLLYGRPDATGSWARHGRRVERAVLELLAAPDLAPREVRGQVALGERACRFRWSGETLALLGATPDGSEGAACDDLPDRVGAVGAALRRARDGAGAPVTIRRGAHLVGAEAGVCLPHLEVRDGDATLYLRVLPAGALAEASARLEGLRDRVPFVLVGWSSRDEPDGPVPAVTLCRPGEIPRSCPPETLLEALRARPGEPALRSAA
jgi:hypothetical protein